MFTAAPGQWNSELVLPVPALATGWTHPVASMSGTMRTSGITAALPHFSGGLRSVPLSLDSVVLPDPFTEPEVVVVTPSAGSEKDQGDV